MSPKNEKNELQYGPNSRYQLIGFVIFLVGVFFGFNVLFLLFDLIPLGFDVVIIFLLDILARIAPALIFGFWGYTWMIGGALTLIFSERTFVHSRFFGRDEFNWMDDFQGTFNLIVRSSKPELKGRKGGATWDVEMWYTPIDKKTVKVTIPEINSETEVVYLVRGLKEFVNALPTGTDIKMSKLIGKTQKITFEIKRKTVRELQIDQSQKKKSRKKK